MLHCATLRDSASNTNTNRTELNWICLCGCTMMATRTHAHTDTQLYPLDNNKDGYENNANSFHNGIGESTKSVDHVHVVVDVVVVVVGRSQVKI